MTVADGRDLEVPDGWQVVYLLQLDLSAWEHSSQHHASLFREFALIQGADPADRAGVPARLVTLIDRLQADYGHVGGPLEVQLQEALAARIDSIDIAVPVPPEVGPVSLEFHDLLEEADAFCASGELLTLRPPHEAAEFRRWYLLQFPHQLSGAAPVPWPVWLATHPAPAAA